MSEESNKSALAFILNPTESHAAATPTLSPSRKPGSSSSSGDEDSMLTSEEEDEELRLRHLSIQGRSLLSETEIVEKQVSRLLALDSHHNGKMRMRKSAICSHDDCGRAAVSRGRCVRHGGGSRCTFPNCTHGARLYNRCFHHGGCKICKVEGCTSKAKRYGYCWSHGGGHICDAPGCTKVAAPGGFCWAHGGGNRCRMEGCNRRSYQKHDYYCKQHTSVGGSSA
ncbi:hypothetical protein Poli38472_012636 [Pythium oligandrum]|uniref:WRKY19-like zinc finger domain-containing protein n=1 Tax=Pythium oligandrum TaxID=41045 RepID=A0A8K1CEQ0_PYTOL|nr:hypothetical protein Poli38472_012636 [Pythium oligandrum]|eukprot:TMW61445.1 hypothetical protein Poli38472_012636 [Pythium oligandrum]